MTGRKIMEEERVFMNAMNTILEMLSLTFRHRCQRDDWLNVSENDLVQKVKHEFNSIKDTLTMDAPHKESIMSNYSAFSREWVAYYSSFGDIMKTMMNWKEENGKGREEDIEEKEKIRVEKENQQVLGSERGWMGKI